MTTWTLFGVIEVWFHLVAKFHLSMLVIEGPFYWHRRGESRHLG